MTKRTAKIIELLDEVYTTEYRCSLNYTSPWELLAATMLSAQCTDERVNIVTKDLFAKYPDVVSFARADICEMERDIHSVGFYRSKAKNIINTARIIHEKYNDEVPSKLEELTSTSGSRKKDCECHKRQYFPRSKYSSGYTC